MPHQPGQHTTTTPATFPQVDEPLVGQYITLENLTEAHLPSLWHHLGLDHSGAIFRWVSWTPPASPEELWNAFENVKQTRGLVIYAIVGEPEHVSPKSHVVERVTRSDQRKEALGTIAFLDIDTKNRIMETGAVLFGSALRRSAAATEAHYLLLTTAFEPREGPPFRRIAWKNNTLNTASRHAAERIGHVFEGTWRNHMILSPFGRDDTGESRDSDFLSIVDSEWPVVKRALEGWLDKKNFDEEGRQIRTLVDIRAAGSRG